MPHAVRDLADLGRPTPRHRPLLDAFLAHHDGQRRIVLTAAEDTALA
ncbi:hypothetical protein [Streptomyces sp. G45]